jgi:iron complex transport system substrate-binding protein
VNGGQRTADGDEAEGHLGSYSADSLPTPLLSPIGLRIPSAVRRPPFTLFVLLLHFAGIATAAPAPRIVSLAPNLTELAFTAGAGELVVGTVEYSDYPQAARAIPRIGDAFRIDYERVLALRPDVVLAWEPGTPQPVIERLRSLQVRVEIVRTRSLADIAAGLRQIGKLAGTQSIAARQAADFEQRIEALRQQFTHRTNLSVFLQINDRPLYTVNGQQIMSEVIALCGGRNVFADLNDLAPQVGVEAVIAADPDVIIATGDARAEGLEMWRQLTYMHAVRDGNLYAVSPDDLARSTTRLAAGAHSLCLTLQTARQKGHQER